MNIMRFDEKKQDVSNDATEDLLRDNEVVNVDNDDDGMTIYGESRDGVVWYVTLTSHDVQCILESLKK